MKLRNKKTGEIGELQITKKHCAVSVGNGTASCGIEIYYSLAKLNEEWEDYEEPKEYWRITDLGELKSIRLDQHHQNIKKCKQIGNYFETKEEAEKAVERLKAWKRLKDKGFRFDIAPALGHCDNEKFDISIIATMPAKWWYNDKVVDDIHYAFGGKE